MTHVYGIEPNTAFAGPLAAAVRDSGLAGKYTAVFCAIEDADELARHGLGPAVADCVVSTQVLCSVDDPRAVAARLYDLLRPGGELIFWEHCDSQDAVTRWAQCTCLLLLRAAAAAPLLKCCCGQGPGTSCGPLPSGTASWAGRSRTSCSAPATGSWSTSRRQPPLRRAPPRLGQAGQAESRLTWQGSAGGVLGSHVLREPDSARISKYSSFLRPFRVPCYTDLL